MKAAVFAAAFAVAAPAVAELLPEFDIRTRSARLEVLQLDLAIHDEANRIGLHAWDGNPAGLPFDEEGARVKVFGARSSTKDETSGVPPLENDTDLWGVYGAAAVGRHAMAADVSGQTQDGNQTVTDVRQTYGRLQYGVRLGRAALGIEAGAVDERQKEMGLQDRVVKSDPAFYGAGVAFEHDAGSGRLMWGANVRTEEREFEFGDLRTHDGRAQAVFRGSAHELAASLRFRRDRERSQFSSAEDDTLSLAFRGRHQQPSSVWVTGWEAAASRLDRDVDSLGQRSSEFDDWTWALGAGLSRLWSQGLAGVQADLERVESTFQPSSVPNARSERHDRLMRLTAGGEWRVKDLLVLRASYGWYDRRDELGAIPEESRGAVTGLGLSVGDREAFVFDIGIRRDLAEVDPQFSSSSLDVTDDRILAAMSWSFGRPTAE